MPLVLSGSNGISTNGTTWALQPDSTGRVTMPYAPAFSANGGTDHNGATGWIASLNPMKFPAAKILTNRGGYMNGTTGIFTCPLAGAYLCMGSVLMGNSGYAQLTFRKNGVVPASGSIIHENNIGTGYTTVGAAIILTCAVGDQITFGDGLGYSGSSIYVDNHGAVSIQFIG